MPVFRKETLLPLAAAAICSGLAAPAIAQSAEEYARQIRRQLNVSEEFFTEKGFRRSHYYEFDQLRAGERVNYGLRLKAGVTYAITVVCDNDCQDLDLVMRNENGKVVASDVKPDRYPVVFVEPRWTGQFQANVSMERCNSSTCIVAIAVYAR